MTTKLIVLVAFTLAFLAGLTVGRRTPRDDAQLSAAAAETVLNSPTTAPSRGNRNSWLAAQLNLSADQQEQLKKIWSDVARRGSARDGQQEDPRRKLRRERDEAIAALVRPEDRAAYDRIQTTYTQQSDALEQQWQASYQNAVERTKAVLTDEQRAKYESILKNNQWSGGQPPRRDRDRTTQPTTRPAD